jgi:hypothetical protein
MPASAAPSLLIVPGTRCVLFLVRAGGAFDVLCVRAARFLDGLRAACAALSFGELHRDEPQLDELLPWAGNV